MTIKQQGGIFGRNPTFNNVTVDGDAAFQEASFNTTADGVVVDVQKNGTTAGGLGVDSGDLIIGTADTGLRFLDSSDAILPWDFAGNAGNNGVIDLGNSSNRFADIHLAGNVVLADGKGIDFSATSGTGTSELFDDYEEGTWTPVLADAASGGNVGTAGVADGWYTKVGNLVTVQCSVYNIVTTGMTSGNDLFVRGLPYAADNLSNTVYEAGSLVLRGITTSGNNFAAVVDGTSYVLLGENVSNADPDFITVGELTTSPDFWFTVTYRTA